MKSLIDEFCKKTGYVLQEMDGKLYYDGSLDLRCTQITTLPDGLTVGGNLDLRCTKITTLPKGLTVGGYLDLERAQVTELPEGLTVGGYLDLRCTKITTLPKGLTVGGHLYIRGTQVTELPEGLTVGGHLYLEGTKITTLPKELTVGGSLYIRGTQVTELPEGLTVGGYLDLRGTQITTLPDGLTVGSLDLEGTKITTLPKELTVGGPLYIRGTQVTELPEGLTVGGHIDLERTNIKDVSKIKRNAPAIYIWKNHKYIKCDGIFNVVVSHHGNVYKVKDIGRTKEYYLVGDGNGKWAHGDTIDDAKKDLLYKISNRDKTGYKNLTLDSILSYEEAIECYRVITGACSSGTKGFCENRLGEIKNHYTIREIIELTEGEYGNNEFKDFFQQVS